MKNIVLMAMLTLVIFSLSFVPVEGQNYPKNFADLRESLPIGDEKTFLDGIVSVGSGLPTVTMNITYDRIDGFSDFEWSYVNRLVFRSYNDFENFLAKNGRSMIDSIRKTGKCSPDSDLILHLNLYYWKINNDGSFVSDQNEIEVYDGLFSSDRSMGKLSEISDSSFRGIEMDIKQLVLPIAHLEALRIVVEEEEIYSWKLGETPKSISPTALAQPPYNYPMTPLLVYDRSPCILIIDNNYIETFGQRKIRLEFTVNGVKQTFTQHGAKLRPAVTSISSCPIGMRISSKVPLGSDAYPEASENLVDWEQVGEMSPWSAVTDKISMDIPTYLPTRFFRVRVK